MAFNTSGLTEYVSPGTEMLLKEILPINLKEFEVQSGIKHKEYLNYLDVTPVKTQSYCSTDSGTDVITQKEIEVANYNYKDNFCMADLDKYALQNEDVAGAIAADMLRIPSMDVNNDLWTGDVGSSDYINGWLTILTETGSGVIDSGSLETSVTQTNIDDIVATIISKRTQAMRLRGILTIYTSPSNYDFYRLNRANANLYNDLNTDLSADEMWLTGFKNKIKITSQEGITTDEMILTWGKNLVIGVDEVTNISNLEFKDAEDRSINAFLDFKLGAEIKYNGEVVYFTPATT